MTHTVLIAEDDPVQRLILAGILSKKLGYRVIESEHGRDAMAKLRNSNPDEVSAVLLDIQMPVMDGFETLQTIRREYPDLPVMMLTTSDDTDVAVRAIKAGANDFIVKPASTEKLGVTLANAIRMRSLTREVARLKRSKADALCFTDLIGYQQGLSEAVSIGRRAASSDVPVLITGETGTGKELFARAIHGESRRVGAPFIAINCGAIPENLVESTLFGHEKGAFTGALNRAIGKFREADGGTVFLDEIGELPLDAQVKLLRVLQQKEVEPVGAGKPVKVDVRIISATNRDLQADVVSGRFREDLYFRLNVLPVLVPPLRERGNDVVTMAEYFIERFAASDALGRKQLTAEARDYLLKHRWPGNVRELENVIHRALVLSDGEQIDGRQLSQIHGGVSTFDAPTAEVTALSVINLSLQYADGRFKTINAIEAEAMQCVLDYYEQNITRAAEVLGIAKSTFYRKLKEAP